MRGKIMRSFLASNCSSGKETKLSDILELVEPHSRVNRGSAPNCTLQTKMVPCWVHLTAIKKKKIGNPRCVLGCLFTNVDQMLGDRSLQQSIDCHVSKALMLRAPDPSSPVSRVC